MNKQPNTTGLDKKKKDVGPGLIPDWRHLYGFLDSVWEERSCQKYSVRHGERRWVRSLHHMGNVPNEV